jgi:4-amino-4-deoxy-L-arabinose transferase-like glycosyltransferase
MTDENPQTQEKKLALAVIVLMLVHLAVTLPLGWVLNIWADEASTLYTTQNGFLPAFQNAVFDEKQAPLYFWVLSLWRQISGSIFFARFFSILCSLLAIKFFFDLTRRLFTRNAAIFVTAVFALHPFLIWASLEIRVYSLIVLLSVLLLKLLEDGFLKEDAKKSARVFFFIFSVIGLYTSYYIGFLLVACFIPVLLRRRWGLTWIYIRGMALAGLLFLPLLRALYTQFSTDSASFHGDHSVVEGLRIIWNFFLTFILPTEIFPPENATAVSLVRVWIVRLAIVAAAILLIKTRKILDEKVLAYGVIAFVISAFLFVSYLFLGDVYVQIRHSAVLFAPAIILTSLVFDRVSTERKILPAALAIILLGFFTYSVYSLYPNLTKRGDWARVAEFIQVNEKPGQPILVFTVFDTLSLPYYYHGRNKVLPDEKYFAWEPEAPFGTQASLQRQTDFVISEIPPGSQEIWLVVNEKCLATEACVPLENFVKANYTITQEKEFYLEKVFLLRRNP